MFCSIFTSDYAERVLYVGKSAPVETLCRPDGTTLSLEELQGKVVLLDCSEVVNRRGGSPVEAINALQEKFSNRDDLIIASTFTGNGILDSGEACDDGNNVNGDGCENNCTSTPSQNGVCGSVDGDDIYDFDNSGDALSSSSSNLCSV